eukprot:10760185-Prorocentrum_lima.AAC.1
MHPNLSPVQSTISSTALQDWCTSTMHFKPSTRTQKHRAPSRALSPRPLGPPPPAHVKSRVPLLQTEASYLCEGTGSLAWRCTRTVCVRQTVA